jgi:hypothetical protein
MRQPGLFNAFCLIFVEVEVEVEVEVVREKDVTVIHT